MADNFETVGVRAVVQNMGGYLSDINRMESATKQSLNHIGMAWGAIGLAGAAGFGLAAKAAIDFEDSFAGVRKTVEATDEELDVLAQGFRDLAKEIPISVNELNAIGETAGAIGIGKDAILEFTEVVAMLGATTNLTTQDAATGLARIANILQLPTEAFSHLGSTLVDLGNKGASTEVEIVDMSLRIAGAGHIIGLSADQVLAFANGLSSVGIEAELGGSAISRIMIEIAKSVELGGEKMQLFADVSGMSAEQFQAAWEQDAASALVTFIENLGKLEEQGGSTFQVLEALGLDAIRVQDTLLRASGAGDLLRESLQNGATAWSENTAMMTEFERRVETTASQIQLLKNDINDAMIEIGSRMLPVIVDAIGVLRDMAEAWDSLPKPVQDATLRLAGVITVMALVGGASLLLVPRIAETVRAFGTLRAESGLMGAGMRALPGILAAVSIAVIALPPVIGLVKSAFSDADEAASGFAKGLQLAAETLQNSTDAFSMAKLRNEIIAFNTQDVPDFIRNSAEFRSGMAAMVQGAVEAGATLPQVFDLIHDAGVENIPEVQKVFADFNVKLKENQAIAAELGIEVPNSLGPLAGAFEDTGEAGEEMAEKQKKAMQQVIEAIQGVLPTVNESFDEWKLRLEEQAEAYIHFSDNLTFILGALTEAHVAEPYKIIAALQQAGPGVTEAMALYLAEQGVDAVSDELALLGQVAGVNVDNMIIETALRAPDVEAAMSALVEAGVISAEAAAAAGGARVGGAFAVAMANAIRSAGAAASPDRLLAEIEYQAGGGGADVQAEINRLLNTAANRASRASGGGAVSSGGGGGGGGGGAVSSGGGATGSGGGGSVAKERTPEEMMVDAAQAADTIASAIEHSMEVFNKLGDFSGAVDFDALRRLRDAIVEAVRVFGEGVNEASLRAVEDAGEWAGNADKVIGLIGSGVDSLMALEDFGPVNRDLLLAFISDYVFAAEQFSARIPVTGAATTAAAAEWAASADKIVGLIGGGVDNLMALPDYADLNRAAFLDFADDYVFAAENFASRINVASDNVTEEAAEWAGYAGDIVSLIGDGVTAFLALDDYAGLSRRALIDFAQDYVFAAEHFGQLIPVASKSVTEDAAEWADSASTLVDTIGDGVDAFASLEDYGVLSRVAFALFIDDYIYGVEAFARRIPAATSELDDAVVAWADASSAVVSVIADGVSGFAALEDYGAVSRRALVTFIDDLIFGVRYFNERVIGWDVDAAEAAGTIAGVAQNIVGAIGAAAEVFGSNLATAGLFQSSLELILDMLIHVVGRFVRETAHLADDASEGAVNLSEVGMNIFSAIVMLGESLQDGYYISSRARERIYDIGRVLVDLVTYFASQVQYFDEEASATTLQLSEAARNIVESFVLMQGELNRVNTTPLFRFMFDLIYGFQNVLFAARALRSGGAEQDMAFLSTLVQFIRDFLEQLGLQFDVPKPPPKPVPPKEEDQPDREPPAPIIPREPLTPAEIEEVIDALISGLFDMIENLDIPDADLDALERKAGLIETMARAFRDIGSAVESVGDADTGAFFNFMEEFLGGLSELLDDLGGIGGSLLPLAQIISSIASLIDNIDKIERVGALDPFVMEQAASNLSTFILETLRILAEGVQDLPLSQLQNLGTVLNAITAFLDSLSGAVGSQLGIPSYDTGSWSVPQTGPAMLHQREMVLTPALADAVRVALSTPALSAPSGNMVTIGEINLNFGAGVDEAMVRRGVGGAITDAGNKGYTTTLRSKGYIQ